MRNLGLDIVRGLAIGMVLVSHSRIFILQYATFQGLSLFGFFGVELFFVLSGFLIGKIIVTEVMETNTWFALRRFYLRRWFRTLPLYYLILFLLIIYGKHIFYWQYLGFVQNFSQNMLNTFPVSWSLAIEEWFYLITPFLLLVIAKLVRASRVAIFFFFCGGIVTISLLGRIIYVLQFNPAWDYGVRDFIFLRMDSLIIGVALAGFKVYYREIYNKITSFTTTIFIVALAGLGLLGSYYLFVVEAGNNINASFFARTFFFSLVSFFCAILIAAFESSKFVNYNLNKYRSANIFRFLSITSYAVYLIHFDMYYYFQSILNATERNIWMSLVYWLLTQGLVFLVAFGLHKCFEKPIMNQRERFSTTK